MKFLNACCCQCCGCRCCSLKSGSVAVGAIHVALWIIGFIIVIAAMCSSGPYTESKMKGLMPVVIFHLIVHSCLIHGAKKGERVLLLPFIVVFGLEVLTAGVGSFIGIYLWSSGYHSIGGYVFLVIPPIIGGMTLAVYLWMIVWSYFIELGETQTGLPYCNHPGNIYEETYPANVIKL